MAVNALKPLAQADRVIAQHLGYAPQARPALSDAGGRSERGGLDGGDFGFFAIRLSRSEESNESPL